MQNLPTAHSELATQLPIGTVTFVLTDVQGSTRLWEQSPDAMREALVRHDALIEHLVADHGGTVIRPRGEGDSRFAVFTAASDAVRAACSIQIALAREPWPIAEPLRVRIAVHTSEADQRDGDYYGRGVNRCARLRALARGGQILVSGTTAMVIRDQPLADVRLKSLGRRKLKDVNETEHVFQVCHPELPDSADVFICHAGDFTPDSEQFAQWLTRYGLAARLDSGVHGDHEQSEVEANIAASTVCAVLIGSRGLENWETGAVSLVLQRARQDPAYRLVPVLLPGAPQPFDAMTLPPPLDTQPWVDLRAGVNQPDAFAGLVALIRRDPIASASYPSPLAESTCPYRGLEAFDTEHAQFFFGRDAETQRLLEQLKRSRFIAVVAASGSGKSSLVRAGLLAALRRGMTGRTEIWQACVLTPGPEPLTTLAAELLEVFGGGAMQQTLDRLVDDWRTLHLAVSLALARQPRTTRLICVVDQFEEVFTQCSDEQQRAAFIGNLLYAATVPQGRVVVLLTLRGDFYVHCARYPELAARIAANQQLLGALTEENLVQAIEAPARRVGLNFEPGLVDTILEDVMGEPGALPLLEHALYELWTRRRGTLLTLEAYRASGGVQAALRQRAEAIYGDLSPGDQVTARQILLRLIQPGEGTEDTRRRSSLDELVTHSSERNATERVVQALANARIVTTSGGQGPEVWIELTHEAVIQGWSRLRRWMDEDRAALRVQRRLTEAARDWQRLRPDDSGLYRGSRLTEALELRARRDEDLNDLEREFLDASVAMQERERRAHERDRQVVIVTLLIGLVAALVLGGLAGLQWWQAEQARQVALAHELAFQADSVRRGIAVQLPRSVLLAGEALRRAPSLQAQRILLLDLALLAKPVSSMPHPDRVQALAYSPDGSRLATAVLDGTARIWDPATGQLQMTLDNQVAVQAVSYSPDGRYLATGGDDRTARVWDAHSGQQLWNFTNSDGVYAVAFSPDGQHIAVATRDGRISVRDLSTGESTASVTHAAPLPTQPFSPDGTQHAEAPGPAIAFSPDGRLLISGRSMDNTARVWDVATGDQVAVLPHAGPVHGVAFSPDGSLVATASADGYVKLWTPTTGQEVAQMAMDKNFPAYTVAFSPDGGSVAAAGYQFNAKVWEVPSGKELVRLPHSDAIQALAYSPDGKYIATAGNESTAHLWDARTGQEVGRVAVERASDVYAVAFSPDGHNLAIASDDRQVSVWQATKSWQVTGLPHDGLAYKVAFSPDGRKLATGSADGAVRVWDASTGQLLRQWQTGGAVYPAHFTPDGRYTAAASYDGNVYLWDLGTGAEVARLAQDDVVFDLEVSHGGRYLAAGTQYGSVRVWDWARRQEVLHVQHEGGVQGIAFTPDDRRLATASLDGTVRLWDVADGKELLRMALPDGHQVYSMDLSPDGRYVATGEIGAVRLWDLATGQEVRLLPHDSLINDLAFSGDGHYIASAGRDGTVRVFEVATGREVASVAHALSANGVAFSPNSTLLATASDDRTVRVWPVSPGNLLEEACSTVRRNLSAQEWQQYLADQPYRKTCSDLP